MKFWRDLPADIDDFFLDLRESAYDTVAIEAKREILTNQITPSSEMAFKKTKITLVEDYDYVNAIGAYGRGRNRYVGLPTTEIHPGSGLTYDHLFWILRMGMTNSVVEIKARPHLDTAAQKVFRTQVPQEMRKAGFKIRR